MLCNRKYKLDVDWISNAVKNNISGKEIAKHYSCSPSLIYLYCKKHKLEWPEIDLIGHKFGDFTVVKRIGTKGEGNKKACYWLCQCKCGQNREYTTQIINNCKIRSCGCYIVSKERSRKNRLWNGYGDIHGKFWSGIKRGAINRKHTFNISIQNAWELFEKQGGKCALSGVEIGFATSSRGWQNGETTASLDRIDSSKGYEIDNIQWVHKELNLMKQGLSQKDFFEWCRKIVSFQSGDSL